MWTTALLTATLLAVPAAAERTLVTGLDRPYEILYGPDDMIWATEKAGRRVLRIDPDSGAVQVAGTITEATHTPGTQDGLLGMALRLPDVFLAYSYDGGFKIAKYRFADGRLGDRRDVVTGLPSSPDHNAGRLVLGPDDRLYYSIGDQGNNQLGRACRLNRAQDPAVLEGKILRIERDGSVPAGNPFGNLVWSLGHRNPQGLVFGGGRLFSSEQGPKTDDEINEIRRGGNYGWPRVAGFRDDLAYAYANWSASPECTAFSEYVVPPGVPTLPESSFTDAAFTPPLRTFHTVRQVTGRPWPTVAPSSLDHDDGVLLMPTLKEGAVHRIPLDGGAPERVVHRPGSRFRDLAVEPGGRRLFVATDEGEILAYPYSRARVRSSAPS